MIIGRKEEQQELLRACNSEYSEFVAVTGRRRIGKTFLIRETFGYKFAFQHSGLANISSYTISMKTRRIIGHFTPIRPYATRGKGLPSSMCALHMSTRLSRHWA